MSDNGKVAKPSLEEAKQFAFSQRALKTLSDGTKVEFDSGCSADELGELGVGMRLYFTSLKFLTKLFAGVAFTFLTTIVVLAILQSYNPDAIQLIGVQQIARSAISAFAETTPTGSGTTTSAKFFTGTGDEPVGGFDKRSLTAITCSLDVAAMFAVLLGIRYLAGLEKKISKDEGVEVRTIGQYSVAVWGLPKDATDRREIAAHFTAVVPSQYGPVAKVFVGRSYGDYLEDTARRNALQLELRSLNAKAAATGLDLRKKISKAEEEIQKLKDQTEHLSEKTLPCLCAFVTVESQKGRAFLLKKYSQGPVGRLFQAKALRFRGTHALRLEAAMEPTNVMWENLQYGALSRLARRSVSALVAFVLLLITTGFVVGATLYEKSLPPVVDCAGTERAGVLPCDLMWALNATTSNADTARGKVKGLGDAVDGNTCSIYVNPNNNIWGVNYTAFWDVSRSSPVPNFNGTEVACAASTCYGCYCFKQGLVAYSEDKDGLRSYCNEYWGNFALSWTLKGLSIVSVLIVNHLLISVMEKLTEFERPHSRSAAELSKGVKLFLAQFINTLVVTLLVYANVPRLSEVPLLFQGAFQDFLPSWYASVGSSLFLTMLSQSVLPIVIRSVSTWAARIAARLQAGSCYTQEELNKLFLGPRFTLSDRTSSVLNLVFLSLALCGGLPATLYLLVLFFVLCEKTDKRFLVKIARAPTMLDSSVMRRFVDILPWAVWVHFALTAWMYATLPSYIVGGVNYNPGAFTDMTGQFDIPVRLRKVTFVMQLTALALLTLGLLIQRNWEGLVALFESKKVADVAVRDTFSSTVEDHLLRGQDSYNLDENPEYAEAMGHLGGETSHPATTAFLDSPLEKTAQQPGAGKWDDDKGGRGGAAAPMEAV